MRRPAALLMGMVGCTAAWAQAPSPDPHGPAYYLLRALLSLGLVIVLIYVVYFVLRRWQLPGRTLSGEGPASVVQSLPLAGGNGLHLVRIGERLFAITAGPQGTRRVGEMDWQEVSGDADEPARRAD